jgi:hypothetical protein
MLEEPRILRQKIIERENRLIPYVASYQGSTLGGDEDWRARKKYRGTPQSPRPKVLMTLQLVYPTNHKIF